MASSSFSSSGSSYSYDVFLNFRGVDTRKIFVGHLYRALERKVLNAFIDAEDLRKGHHLSDLLKAITDSKISIVVFSQNYASSTWCLKELVQIMKCKERQEQIVVPVFYQVEPSHVRKQEGRFAQAFSEHESNKDLQLQEVQRWRSALKKAASFSGWDSTKYEDDAKLIDDIVDHVFKEWVHISSSKNNHLVGMDSRLDKMRQRLRLEKDDGVLRVGIWGMGGIGKTTIATEVYDEIRYQFDHCSFLRDVKEGFSRDQVGMQKQLLYGILKKDDRIDTLNDGYKIMKRLSKKKVLFVLDDVDNRDQIETLLGHEPSFGGGSRIVVTTRDRGILNEFERYEAELLSDGDALKLFNQYAFKRNKPPGEYDHFSRRALEYAQGLPLALRILGSHLVGRSVSDWEEELDKIKKFPNLGIQGVLRTSFDGLDGPQKKLFLDIACFFKGVSTDYVIKVLGSCDGFYPNTGLKVLVEKALVTISKFGGIEMHDLLQEIGKGIVQSEKPWKHSRLCNYEDVPDVLTRNKAMKVEGIMVELSKSRDTCLDAESFVRMMNLRLLRIIYPPRFGRSMWPNQYLIEANNCKQYLTGDLKFLSHKLRVLTWHGCPLKSLPSNFDPKNLVDLDMRYSHIEQLWEGTKSVKELKSIDLSCCEYLNKIPHFTEAPKLEKLFLERCRSLLEVDLVSALENLVFLSFVGCTELKKLPSRIHLMKSLKFLNLAHCKNLEMFPEILEDMEALLKLKLGYSGIRELPSSIERLRRLESLSMTHCKSLVCLPDSICNLAELSVLELRFCDKLCNLPENFGNLQSLRALNVLQTGLKQLPVSTLRLKLGSLTFHGCRQMEAPLSSWPSFIEDRCTAVVHINLSWTMLLELPDAIVHFSSLKKLTLSSNNLESLPAIMNQLVCLEQLELQGCKRLKSIPELSEINFDARCWKILSRWTQQVRVTSGLMQGPLDDGFSWSFSRWSNLGNGYYRTTYSCNKPSCYAKSKLITSDDPTILKITYIGRHTCWKTQPMLTHQVRVKPGMGPEEGPFDGISWRKYGQKDFLGAKYPRVYYVCIPQNVRGCMAIKEVQLSDDDMKILKITYRGRHTCIQASTISIGGISKGGGALRIHDQVVQSPKSLGDNGSGGNLISLADRAMDGNNFNMLPDANSQDMEHVQDVNYMANKDVAGYPNYGGVVSEGTSEAVVNRLEEEDPMVKLNAFFVRLGNCCCSFLHCFGL